MLGIFITISDKFDNKQWQWLINGSTTFFILVLEEVLTL